MSDSALVGDSTAKDTVSQLFARVLSQLSLSAWLPAAGLVMILLFVFELAGQITLGFPQAVIGTFRRLSNIQLGGLTLIVIAIVVTTMLSQAFSFGAIRRLEGYWGASKFALILARKGSNWQSRVRRGLSKQHDRAIQAAWVQVHQAIRSTQRGGLSKDREKSVLESPLAKLETPPKFTAAMTAKLKERIVGVAASRRLSADQALTVRGFDWEAYVDRETLHTLRSAENRLRDFPQSASHVMPTRLGNVLRRAEDATGQEDVEQFVERVFDRLPFSLQLSHDQERSRLDLYCAMVFILWFAVVPASLAFVPLWQAWPACVLVAVAGSWICYSAALASARHYGAILIAIAEHVEGA